MKPAPDEPGSPADEPLLITPDMLASPEAPAEARLDFEQGISVAPAASLALIATLVVVFALELAWGALVDQASIVRFGAMQRARVLQGEVWRLLSACFLHGGIDHLAGNCLALYVLGVASEHAWGAARTLGLFLFAGATGFCLSGAWSEGASVGASGAIFGLQAALVVFFWRYRDQVHLRDKRIGSALLMWGLYQIGVGALTPFVDNAAHVGGAVGGAAAGLVLGWQRLEQRA